MGLFVSDSFLTFSALLSLRGTGHCGLPGFQVTWLSLCGVSGPWCALFEPSEHLWWVWGLILNGILPLLQSCWGLSFALGCGVSPKMEKLYTVSKNKTGSWLWLNHEFLIVEFRLKSKKVGKTTRPFRCDLNKIPMQVKKQQLELYME